MCVLFFLKGSFLEKKHPYKHHHCAPAVELVAEIFAPKQIKTAPCCVETKNQLSHEKNPLTFHDILVV